MLVKEPVLYMQGWQQYEAAAVIRLQPTSEAFFVFVITLGPHRRFSYYLGVHYSESLVIISLRVLHVPPNSCLATAAVS